MSAAAFALAAAAAWAQPPPEASPRPELDPGFLLLPAHELEAIAPPAGQAVRVGDRIRLRIDRLEAQDGALKLEQPPGATESLQEQGWEILDPSAPSAAPVDPTAGKAGEPVLDVVVLKGGRITLPSLAIKNAEGKSIGRTNPYQLDVGSAIKADDPKPEEPADLRPPVSLRFPWLLVALAALLLLLVVAGVIYALRRWSQSRKPFVAPPMPAGPPRPEDEVALEALAELERQGLTRKGQFKPHYFALSEILKRYLGARYRFEALESTSREIIGVLEEKRAAPDELIDRLEALFETLDRVKFSDHVPPAEEGVSLLALARQLVTATRKPPAPAPVMGQQPQGGAHAV
jgi:hypothetical protein